MVIHVDKIMADLLRRFPRAKCFWRTQVVQPETVVLTVQPTTIEQRPPAQ